MHSWWNYLFLLLFGFLLFQVYAKNKNREDGKTRMAGQFCKFMLVLLLGFAVGYLAEHAGIPFLLVLFCSLAFGWVLALHDGLEDATVSILGFGFGIALGAGYNLGTSVAIAVGLSIEIIACFKMFFWPEVKEKDQPNIQASESVVKV